MIDLDLKKNANKYKAILNAIRQYKKIAIFRHIHPDFDALGSAWGLREFLHDNFMDKDIRVLGDNHDELSPRLYPKTSKTPNEWFKEPFLAIVLDTPNKRRIADPRYPLAEFTIKIDHHPFIENIGDIELIDDSMTSVSELLVHMLLSYDMKLGKNAAKYLYTGIVGDTGRFEYNYLLPRTYECAKILVSTGIDLNDIYYRMYLHNQNDLGVIAHILTHYKVTDKGTAYYVLNKKDLDKFKITTSQGKDHVNLFRYVEGVKIWCSVAEDKKEENCFRVSLRSENIDLIKVSNKWRGGGHKFAAGAKLESLAELPDLIKDLDNLIK